MVSVMVHACVKKDYILLYSYIASMQHIALAARIHQGAKFTQNQGVI